MSAPPADEIVRYFTPAGSSFWRWSGTGCAEIETAREPVTLLAFRGELRELLSAMQPQGWPPLSSILLLMAATRESWPMVREPLRGFFDVTSPKNPFVADVIEQLDRLHALPADLRESTNARHRLLMVVFEGSRPLLNATQAAEGLKLLTAVIPHREPDNWDEEELPKKPGVRFADWTRSLRIGLARLNEESLRSRQLTGLDHVVLPAPIPQPPPLPTPALPSTHAARLWEWSHDPQLYGVARIARQLLSVATWPRRLSQPDDLPLGGVSDLTNRGPLDRLLLTELAQDDDALMVRIALNEALYLRRECPRQESAHRRTILVDAGLRMWGRPRVFGAAVALAMAAAQDREASLTVVISVTNHEGWRSPDIDTRDGALELLGALSPKLHPGDCLEEWRAWNDSAETDHEYVLVTTPDVVRQPEFQQQLTHLPVDLRIALVDGNGRFELHTHSSHGWRTEFTAELDLDELLKPPPETRTLSLTTSAPDRYPAILRITSFPLLLTHQLEPGYCFPVGDDKMVTLASGGRVLLWTQSQRGGRQLATDVPRGKVETWSTMTTAETGHSQRTLAVLRAKQWTLLTIHAEARTCHTVELKSDWAPFDPTVRAVILPECVVLISKRGMAAFSLTSGEWLHTSTEYQLHEGFHGNRYLYCPGDHWHRLSFDGELRAERVPTAKNLLMLIDPPETYSPDGPIEVPADGVREAGTHRVPPFRGSEINFAEQRGDLVLVAGRFETLNNRSGGNYASCAIWDMNHSEHGWNLGYHSSQHELAFHHRITHKFHTRPALRTKLAGIVCDGSMVCLVSTKQKWWRIKPTDDKLTLSPQAILADVTPAPLERLRWPGVSTVMHTAKLANGNAVWLDARGLLHLLPADAQQPEITLVLDENAISGWVSDGRQFGDAYYLTNFLAGGEHLSIMMAWQTLIAPFFGIRS